MFSKKAFVNTDTYKSSILPHIEMTPDKDTENDLMLLLWNQVYVFNVLLRNVCVQV